MKSILLLSDLHCGHWAGLTDDDHMLPEHTKIGQMQRETRAIYEAGILAMLPPSGRFDWCYHLGDAIDGKGTKSEGVELIEPDVMEQANMAIRLMEKIPTLGWSMVFGTPYHTGIGEDHERAIASALSNATIHGMAFHPVEGIVVNLRHHAISSSVMYGGFTALAKERFAIAQWSHEQGWPNPDVIIRGHVHEKQSASESCGIDTASGLWEVITCPALQAASTKHGRRLMKVVHYGLGRLDVDDTQWQTHWHIREVTTARPHILEALR